jgi:hypothetical protein
MKKRDVLIAVLTILLLGFVAFCFRAKKIAQSISCGNNMSSIGLAARIWSEDNSNRLAGNFLVMSNELATPKVLICPSDVFRKPANSWAEFTTNNCSYEILRPGMDGGDFTNAYFRCPVHGHLGFADGTVFDGKRRRTKWP